METHLISGALLEGGTYPSRDDVQHYSYPSIASHILQLEKYLISVDPSKLKIY